jgi:hypothetical protein
VHFTARSRWIPNNITQHLNERTHKQTHTHKNKQTCQWWKSNSTYCSWSIEVA